MLRFRLNKPPPLPPPHPRDNCTWSGRSSAPLVALYMETLASRAPEYTLKNERRPLCLSCVTFSSPRWTRQKKNEETRQQAEHMLHQKHKRSMADATRGEEEGRGCAQRTVAEKSCPCFGLCCGRGLLYSDWPRQPDSPQNYNPALPPQPPNTAEEEHK